MSSQLQHGKLIRAALIRLDCLVLHISYLHVFGRTCQVGQAYRQVGWSSSRPDPLVGDGREPSRWGPSGTLVSQAPERCVGAATLEGHDEVIKLSTGRIACTSIDGENPST
jgi:hypothetical protein